MSKVLPCQHVINSKDYRCVNSRSPFFVQVFITHSKFQFTHISRGQNSHMARPARLLLPGPDCGRDPQEPSLEIFFIPLFIVG
jgi:hypothetical protein